MTIKTTNVLYWVFTILFALLMLFSAYASLIVNEDSVKLIHDQLGYPVYFIPFTGVAKLIGSIVILIPGLKIIKWGHLYMNKSRITPVTVDDYIAASEGHVKKPLKQIREIIRSAAPDAEEVISYQIPAYKQNGMLVFFAGYKNHIGFYPTAS